MPRRRHSRVHLQALPVRAGLGWGCRSTRSCWGQVPHWPLLSKAAHSGVAAAARSVLVRGPGSLAKAGLLGHAHPASPCPASWLCAGSRTWSACCCWSSHACTPRTGAADARLNVPAAAAGCLCLLVAASQPPAIDTERRTGPVPGASRGAAPRRPAALPRAQACHGRSMRLRCRAMLLPTPQ